MKKLTALVMAVLFVLFAFGIVYAADISVTVTMATYTLNVSNLTWAIGSVTPSLDTNRQQVSHVWNTGGVNMDVTLLCTDATTWKLKSTTDASGKDSFLMRAIFADEDTTVAGVPQDSFKSNDALTTGAQEGTNALFYTTNCGSGADAAGLDMAANDSVSLWLWFKAPTTSTTAAEQTIAITVGGKVAD